MPYGVVNVVKSRKESEFEWKINYFSLSKCYYESPEFKFEGESWWLKLCSIYPDTYMILRLYRYSSGCPIEVEFSVSLKNTERRKRFKRHERCYFDGQWCVFCDIDKWIKKREFITRQREFLSAGCLTIIFTLKRADSESESQYELESGSASGGAAASCTKDSRRVDKMSLDRSFLDKLVKCPQCDKVLRLKNSFDHECQIANAKAARSETMCSCCKERLHEDKITFHKECLNKEAKCPRCHEVVNLQNWFDHVCQMENVQAANAAAVCSCCKENIAGDKISFHKDCLGKTSKCPRCDEAVSLPNWFDHVCEMANVRAAVNISGPSVTCNHGSIIQDLKQLLLNQEQTDVILRVKGKEFSAHKTILAARSSVFASTFRHGMKENKTGIVDIEDCEPAVFPEFLCFLYSNDTGNLSSENTFALFKIADKYDCQYLRAKCVHFIKMNLTVEMFCKALALSLLHSEAELLRVATDFFIENADKILVTVEWQTFNAENATYCNELFIKYVNSTKRANR